MKTPQQRGRSARIKGNDAEREVAALLPGSVKVARSGYATHDIEWRNRTVEVKRRAQGFAMDYRWLQDAQILVKRQDRAPRLVTMELDTLLDLLDE